MLAHATLRHCQQRTYEWPLKRYRPFRSQQDPHRCSSNCPMTTALSVEKPGSSLDAKYRRSVQTLVERLAGGLRNQQAVVAGAGCGATAARGRRVLPADRVGGAPRRSLQSGLEDQAQLVRSAELDQTAQGAVDVAGGGVDEQRRSSRQRRRSVPAATVAGTRRAVPPPASPGGPACAQAAKAADAAALPAESTDAAARRRSLRPLRLTSTVDPSRLEDQEDPFAEYLVAGQPV